MTLEIADNYFSRLAYTKAAEYYQKIFTEIYNSDEWQGYLASESLSPLWMDASEQREYWALQVENHKKLLDVLGE